MDEPDVLQHLLEVEASAASLVADAQTESDNRIAEAEKQGVKDQVQIVKTGCFGFCEKGPIVKVLPEDSFYVEVKPQDARKLFPNKY